MVDIRLLAFCNHSISYDNYTRRCFAVDFR